MGLLSEHIAIIGVPSDMGANKRGACMGPSAIRIAGLHTKISKLGKFYTDYGDVNVPVPETIFEHFKGSNHLNEIETICKSIKRQVENAYQQKQFPLLLGGDHSLSIGSVSAMLKAYSPEDICVLWIDTHADINTPDSSPTKNIHGMPLNILMGNGYKQLTQLVDNRFLLPENIFLVGLHSVDKNEKTILKNGKVNYFTMRDIDEMGIQKVMKKITTKIARKKVHVSFDMDVMDPGIVPGVSTPEQGGLLLREAHLLLELVYENCTICSVDFVELNAYQDIQGKSARIAVELISSIIGKQIV